MTRLLFLDIDGVLNCHEDIFATGIHTIDPAKVKRLNRIVAETGAEIVISSAWRYMILGGAMTLDGFRYMLNTYGLHPDVKLHGHTTSDELIHTRGGQIDAYVRAFGRPPYVVLDDGSDERQQDGLAPTMTQSLLAEHATWWVKVDGEVGLNDACADRAVALLRSARAVERERCGTHVCLIRMSDDPCTNDKHGKSRGLCATCFNAGCRVPD